MVQNHLQIKNWSYNWHFKMALTDSKILALKKALKIGIKNGPKKAIFRLYFGQIWASSRSGNQRWRLLDGNACRRNFIFVGRTLTLRFFSDVFLTATFFNVLKIQPFVCNYRYYFSYYGKIISQYASVKPFDDLRSSVEGNNG